MSQTISVIGAFSINGVYGEGNEMVWKILEDFKHFKKLTIEWTVIMGRLTRESLPRKPLPHRENIVVSSNASYKADGAIVCTSFEQALAKASTNKIFCIGGKEVWYKGMDIADEAWITVVKNEYPITPGVTRTAPDLINPPARWPGFSFNEMVVNRDAEGDTPGFSIVHWVRKK